MVSATALAMGWAHTPYRMFQSSLLLPLGPCGPRATWFPSFTSLPFSPFPFSSSLPFCRASSPLQAPRGHVPGQRHHLPCPVNLCSRCPLSPRSTRPHSWALRAGGFTGREIVQPGICLPHPHTNMGSELLTGLTFGTYSVGQKVHLDFSVK